MENTEQNEWYNDSSQLDVREDVNPDADWQSNQQWTGDGNEHSTGTVKQGGAEADDRKTESDLDRQEYERMEIPVHWLPLPLFLVRNIPVKRDIAEEEVKRMIEGVRQLKVHSVHFDQQGTEKVMGRRTALVRLQPLPLPWQTKTEDEARDDANDGDGSKEEDEGKGPKSGGEDSREGHKRGKNGRKNATPPKDGDAGTYANWAVQKLKMQNPPFNLGGEQVIFENSTLQVQLYIGNLSPDWQEDVAFMTAMSQYGSLERAYVMRNAKGLSKGYGFVEFSLPSGAVACKRAMDEIERNMRPDPKKMHKPPPRKSERKDEGKEDNADNEHGDAKDEKRREEERSRANAFKLAGWPEGGPRLVKLLRAEWASIRTVECMFSKVLYVANLRTHHGSQQQLKELFDQFGEVQEVTVPKNKATNSTKGFAFVLYHNGISADSAYRALEKSGSEEIGGALVSFANSAKQADYQGRNGMVAAQRPSNQSNRGLPQAMRPGQAPPPGFPPTRGAGRGLPPGRAPPFPQAPSVGRALPGRGRGFIEPTDHYRTQLQMQQDLQAQQMRMQQEMEARLQSQMQAQLRQAQLQLQQAQQQTQLLQRQALQAQQKAAAEAEARKRAEDEARRAAAMASASKGLSMPPKRGPGGFGGMGEGMGGRGPQAGFGAYPGGGAGSSGGGTPPKLSSAQYSHGDYQPSPNAGFNGSPGGHGSQMQGPAGFGKGGYGAVGSQGYGAGDYGGSSSGGAYASFDYDSYGAPGGYGGASGEAAGYGQGGYDQGGSYEQGYGYGGEGGYEAGGQAGYGGGQSEYGSAGYGQASAAGYGESSVYGQSGYGEYGQQPSSSASQKRSNPYQQAGYGGYGTGGGGSYGAQGEAGKRPRY